MPRRVSAPKRPTTATLAQSELHIRLEGLEAEHERLLKQIKKKRSELNNFLEQMRSCGTEIYQRTAPNFQKLRVIDEEIHNLFEEILKTKKLGKQSKRKIEQIYYNLQRLGIISPKFDDTNEETEVEEFEVNNDTENDDSPFGEYQQQQYQRPPEIESPSANKSEESKKIRSFFLRLAEIFHPDKASDNETQIRNTEIMKEINKAYQEGDLARLLEIEQQHQVGEDIDINSEDDLTRKCNRLEQQNQFLKTQYETLKQELRASKKTVPGSIVSDFRKSKKKGFDPIDEILEQVENQMDMISEIRDYVKDFHSSKMTLKDFLSGPAILHELNQRMMENLLEQMFSNSF